MVKFNQHIYLWLQDGARRLASHDWSVVKDGHTDATGFAEIDPYDRDNYREIASSIYHLNIDKMAVGDVKQLEEDLQNLKIHFSREVVDGRSVIEISRVKSNAFHRLCFDNRQGLLGRTNWDEHCTGAQFPELHLNILDMPVSELSPRIAALNFLNIKYDIEYGDSGCAQNIIVTGEGVSKILGYQEHVIDEALNNRSQLHVFIDHHGFYDMQSKKEYYVNGLTGDVVSIDVNGNRELQAFYNREEGMKHWGRKFCEAMAKTNQIPPMVVGGQEAMHDAFEILESADGIVKVLSKSNVSSEFSKASKGVGSGLGKFLKVFGFVLGTMECIDLDKKMQVYVDAGILSEAAQRDYQSILIQHSLQSGIDPLAFAEPYLIDSYKEWVHQHNILEGYAADLNPGTLIETVDSGLNYVSEKLIDDNPSTDAVRDQFVANGHDFSGYESSSAAVWVQPTEILKR